jgi:folate-binding protein YgfZ
VTETLQLEEDILGATAAVAALADRAFLRVRGSDATRWLNGMVTNSVRDLAPGEGNYNFLLNAQGRIQGDCTIFRDPNADAAEYLLETDVAQIPTIQPLLEHFIIMDDVELSTVSDLSGILVAGPQAPSVVMGLGTANDKAAPCSSAAVAPQSLSLKQTFYDGAPVQLIQAHGPLVPRFEIWSDPSTIASMQEELQDAHVRTATSTDIEALRILEGTPKYGIDIRHTDLPQETGQTRALHFNKGCYLGQEIVERIRSRGQVHRTFMSFTINGKAPELPAKLEVNGKAAGELTSTVDFHGSRYALGYTRREFLIPGTQFTYPGGVATPRY